MTTLKDKLDTLAFDAKRNVKCINNGGCAVFASLVGQRLLDLNVKGVGLRSSDYCSNNGRLSIDAARKKLRVKNAYTKHWNEAGVEFGHVVLEFLYRNKPYHFDSDMGVFTADKAYGKWQIAYYKGALTVEEGLIIASGHPNNCWNDMFDRSDIPTLKRLINKHLR